MTFENEYDELRLFAKKYITQKRAEINANDIVNDAYLIYVDSGKPYIQNEIRKSILRLVNDSLNEVKNISLQDFKYGKVVKERSKYCKSCNEDLPLAAFRQINSNRINCTYFLSKCNSCLRQYMINHKLKNIEHYNKLNTARVSKFVENNRDEWNAYLRKRYHENKEKNREKNRLKAQIYRDKKKLPL